MPENQENILKGKKEDIIFARLAIRKGLVKQDEILKSFEIQKSLEEQHQPKRIGNILVKEGLLTADQAQKLLDEVLNDFIICDKCLKAHQIKNYQPGTRVKCKKCSYLLTIPTKPGVIQKGKPVPASPAPVPPSISARTIHSRERCPPRIRQK